MDDLQSFLFAEPGSKPEPGKPAGPQRQNAAMDAPASEWGTEAHASQWMQERQSEQESAERQAETEKAQASRDESVEKLMAAYPGQSKEQMERAFDSWVKFKTIIEG